ncbi:MAG TPA: hypothetical protein DCW31_11800 [Lactobacillus sp.]|nr:hypothetical protein [Lactobacillus sp.]
MKKYEKQQLDFFKAKLDILMPNVEKVELALGMQAGVLRGRVLTISQAAKVLGLSTDTLQDWLSDPDLPRLYVGRTNQPRLMVDSLLRYAQVRAANWYRYLSKDGEED